MDSSGADGFAPMQEVMLEFRAGKMFTEGTRVMPDTRKGLVRIAKELVLRRLQKVERLYTGNQGTMGEEGLVHFQWLDRTQHVMEDDQIVFPDEAIFEKVEQSSGRVYILKFNTDNREIFLLDEPKSDGDVRICTLVNYHINRPLDLPEDEAEASVPFQASDVSEDTGNEMSSRDGNLDTTNMATETAGEVSSSGPVQLSDLQRILSSIEPAGSQDTALGLGDILKPDLLLPLIKSLPLEQRLASYLPEGQWTPDDLIELLQSPPFRQQVESFTYVLRTGQIDLSQFGIDPSKYKFSVLSFLEALEDSVANNPDLENVMLESRSVAASDSNPEADKDCQSQRHSGEDRMDESQ